MVKPFFKPRKGRQYGKKSGFGIPVMIMGESHYGCAPSGNWNIDIVDQVISGERKKGIAFHTNITKAFLGKSTLDGKDLRDFWDSVLFYNYVQEIVGPTTRSRPSRAMLKSAEEPFLYVLAKYKPKLIAVFGYTAWEGTPSRGKDVDSIKAGRQRIQCYEFSVNKTRALAPRLLHASRGFSPREWHPVLLEALKRAGGHEFRR